MFDFKEFDSKEFELLFIYMDNLRKIAKEYVNNDNPNDLQSIYASHLLDFIVILPSD